MLLNDYSMQYEIISFYKYVPLSEPEEIRDHLKIICKNLNLLGRILISKEGINGAVSGSKSDIEKFKHELKTNLLFSDLTFREQEADYKTHHKLVVKLRKEICAFDEKVDLQNKGKHLPPKELKKWYDNNEEFYIVDARNDYEYKVGKFKGAIELPIKNFREFPQGVEVLEPLKDKKVVLYCTGGVRCEKASAYMKDKGFRNVYQIEGGIINYVNSIPENKEWEGGLFVFDDRLVSDLSNPITECKHCKKECSKYVNCHNLDCDKLTVMCEECQKTMNKTCSQECKEAKRQRKETAAKKVIGIVENYYPKAGAALIKVNEPIQKNSTISIAGKTTKEFTQAVEEVRYDEDNLITIAVIHKVRKNDKVLA